MWITSICWTTTNIVFLNIFQTHWPNRWVEIKQLTVAWQVLMRVMFTFVNNNLSLIYCLNFMIHPNDHNNVNALFISVFSNQYNISKQEFTINKKEERHRLVDVRPSMMPIYWPNVIALHYNVRTVVVQRLQRIVGRKKIDFIFKCCANQITRWLKTFARVSNVSHNFEIYELFSFRLIMLHIKTHCEYVYRMYRYRYSFTVVEINHANCIVWPVTVFIFRSLLQSSG